MSGTLSIRNLSKSIGSIVALNSATFSVNRGEVAEVCGLSDGSFFAIVGLNMGIDLGAEEAALS